MNGKWRQKLHLEPPHGWLNDPNGLCFFGGKYHFYFQYCPSSPYGEGEKCWGHYESPELLSWEFTGIVLRPDIPEDADGVYSGSALPIGDELAVFYTGNVKEKGDYDYITAGRGANVISVRSANGREMGEKTVLLRNSDYPEYCSCHVRDPKVWRENGVYKMVLGARTLDNRGAVLLYRSDDTLLWEFENMLTVPDFGYMWECPDLFGIDEKSFLSVSPQGLAHEEYHFQNIYSSGYFKFENELFDFEEWDFGFDFYAPQTFVSPDGRRIMVGWMGIGDIPYCNPTAELGWQHCLTIPRELSLSPDWSILQNPIRELERLREESIELADGEEKTVRLPFDLTARVKDGFRISFGSGFLLSYDGCAVSLKFTDGRLGCGRTERKTLIENCGDVRIIADMSSLEVFLGGGKRVMSTRIYPVGDTVELRAEGLDASIYRLREMEMKMNG